MDQIDRQIAFIVQADGRASSAEIAGAVGVSVSTANERVRRLAATGVIKNWRAVLDPVKAGLGICAFIFVDVGYEREDETKIALTAHPEIQEIHHISGARSYLLKIRVADTNALQLFLQQHIKSLQAVARTETIIVLETVKETTELQIDQLSDDQK